MSDNELRTSRFFCLDIARGLAIISIILFHAIESDRRGYGTLLRTVMSSGYLGVPVFFLISGYSICSSITSQRGTLSGLPFLLKRLKRIYIPYWWSLIFACIVVPITIKTLNYFTHISSNIPLINYSVTDWLEVITLIKVFFSDGWHLGAAFTPLWSNWFIAVIVQIYLVVSVILGLKVSLYKACMVLSFASLLSIIPTVKSVLPEGFFLPYWIDFSTGILLFYMIHGVGHSWYHSHKGGITLAFASTILFAFLFIVTSQEFFLCLSGAVIAYAVYPYDNLISTVFLSKVMAFIGQISYSLYLIHSPLLWIIIPNLYIFRLPMFISHTVIPVSLIIIIGYVWYVFFEKQSTLSSTVLSFVKPFDTLRSDYRSHVMLLK